MQNILRTWWFQIALAVVIVVASVLRLYALDRVPGSLYWEEVALGYDAYSITQTGKDHHGNPWPVVAFTSFGDYKPSGYFYLAAAFIKVFGLSEWSVRLPSALAGIFMVIGIGVFTRQCLQLLQPKYSRNTLRLAQVFGSTFAAVSPWLTQFSRGGWEVNVASTLLLWGVVTAFWARATEQRQLAKWVLSAAFFAASMYTYHATRVIAPLLLASLFGWTALEKSLSSQKQTFTTKAQSLAPIFFTGVMFCSLISPILIASKSTTTQQRFAETSILADGQYVEQSNQARAVAKAGPLTQLFTHRYLYLIQQVVEGFTSHFRLDFLFLTGDLNPRHSTGSTGLFYATDLIWFVVGVVALAYLSLHKKQARPVLFFLITWIVVGILPAALTKATPHALRILATAPVFFVIISYGCLHLLQWIQHLELPKKQLFSVAALGVITVICGTQVFRYLQYYALIYPKTSALDWQFGYKEMVQQLGTYNDGKTPVYITREYGRPAMYYWFYSQTSPQEVQAEEKTAKKDQAEFLQFKNITFINTVNEAKPGIISSSLSGFEQLSEQFSSVEKLAEVRDPRGQVVWIVARVQ
jgi:hypothetical protein